MNKCSDSSIGDMLHAFELNLLSDLNRRTMEIHIIECDYCSEKLSEFQKVTWMIRSDLDFKVIVDDVLKEEAERESGSSWLPEWLQTQPVYKYAVGVGAVMMILVFSYPVLKMAVFNDNEQVIQQVLNLNSSRGATISPVISIEQGGEVIINFNLKGAETGDLYNVSLISRAGDEIYSADGLAIIDDTGSGTIVIPVDRFNKGFYILKITDLSGKSPENEYKYNLIVK